FAGLARSVSQHRVPDRSVTGINTLEGWQDQQASNSNSQFPHVYAPSPFSQNSCNVPPPPSVSLLNTQRPATAFHGRRSTILRPLRAARLAVRLPGAGKPRRRPRLHAGRSVGAMETRI